MSIKIIIIILTLIGINISNINNLHKNLLNISIFFYTVINHKIEYFTVSNELLEYNKYDIKSYDNVEHKTSEFYKNQIEKLFDSEKSDLDLNKYGWPSNFNEQTVDYLDKIRFIETDLPIPTNPDFFI